MQRELKDKVSPLWLARTREFRPPIDEFRSIWIRHGAIHSGAVVPTPESHPCCEFSIIFSGVVRLTSAGEAMRRTAGDIFLVAPGLPHDHQILKYPVRYCTIFFQPSLLIEMAPEGAGRILLQRFLMHQSLKRRLLHLPLTMRSFLINRFEAMIVESEKKLFGFEVQLRTLLLTTLIELRRWEIALGQNFEDVLEDAHWDVVCRALTYLHENSSEAIYAKDLARAAGASPSRLRAHFHNLLGTTWGRCLIQTRVERVAALLCHSKKTMTEIAQSCGFQTLSHFNSAFLNLMGCTPTDYRSRKNRDIVY
jgi:AraC-like DNA-binding protein